MYRYCVALRSTYIINSIIDIETFIIIMVILTFGLWILMKYLGLIYFEPWLIIIQLYSPPWTIYRTRQMYKALPPSPVPPITTAMRYRHYPHSICIDDGSPVFNQCLETRLFCMSNARPRAIILYRAHFFFFIIFIIFFFFFIFPLISVQSLPMRFRFKIPRYILTEL